MNNMPLIDIILFISLIVLIFLSAFFSGSETSFFALNKFKLLHLVREKNKTAIKIKNLLDSKESLIGAILLGNNLVNVAASSISTYLFLKYFGNSGIFYSTLIMTFILLIFAEITPKVYSSTFPEKVSFFAAHIIDKIIFIFKPFLYITTFLSTFLLKLFSVKSTKDKLYISKEELKTLILTGEKSGFLDKDKREMLNNLLEFSELIVKDVMIPRIDVVMINLESNINDIIEIMKTNNYSRYPVYKENIDNIVGILHTKTFLNLFTAKKEINISDIANNLQKVFYTSEFTKIEFLLKKMKQNKNHLAVVVDEYGGFEGIVTLEDILEEIVGEIQDEFDSESEKFIKINDNTYILEGDFSIKKFNEIFSVDLPHEDESTLAGFFIANIGKIPENYETITYKNFKFTVLKIDKRTIKKLKVEILTDEKNKD